MTKDILRQYRALRREAATLQQSNDSSQLCFVQNQIKEIEVFINTTPDSLMRQILRCRYVKGMTWTKTARIVGGSNTGDSVRVMHDRYLKKTGRK